jgi:hypothetical protein
MSPDTIEVGSKYGAPMGRCSLHPTPGKVHLYRVRLNQGGYDKGGAYWGIGAPLWCVWNGGGFLFLRAETRELAKSKAQERLPGVRFYR